MKFPFQSLMVQGTTSDAGKTTVVAALCRLLARHGIKVAPFKPQNMALNSAVTIDGGEIGRSQALQAQAACLAPHTDMNPVLLKPAGSGGVQLIIQGHVRTNAGDDWQQTAGMPAVLESYRRLAAQYDAIIVEGAGSPAEVNLRARDIANMGFAEAVDCPVLLVADIDRGGVFAQILGTLACLSESEGQRIIGFVINRFRGERHMLESGLRWLEQQTGKPVLAVLPYLHDLHLDAEDGLQPAPRREHAFRILVPQLPALSNHTDFDILRAHPGVDLVFASNAQIAPPADLIILPGSKNTRSDLAWLEDRGWPPLIKRHLRYGGKLIGICGGFQMLGQSIADPGGVEGPAGTSQGLGLLELATVMTGDKRLARVSGYCSFAEAPAAGYEIHAGRSTGAALARPAFLMDGQPEGALSADGQILGSYLHGLFDLPQACNALLQWAGLAGNAAPDLAALREQSLNRIADAATPLLNALMERKLA